MIYKFVKNISCTKSIICALTIQNKLENPNLKLHADNETDTVNGSITIRHIQGAHEIIIEIYDNDQSPNTDHKSTFKKPVPIPTKNQINALL